MWGPWTWWFFGTSCWNLLFAVNLKKAGEELKGLFTDSLNWGVYEGLCVINKDCDSCLQALGYSLGILPGKQIHKFKTVRSKCPNSGSVDESVGFIVLDELRHHWPKLTVLVMTKISAMPPVCTNSLINIIFLVRNCNLLFTVTKMQKEW